MNCPNCGNAIQAGDAFCDNCGTLLKQGGAAPSPVPGGFATPEPAPPLAPTAPMAGGSACPSCGGAVLPGEAFCENCGAALDQPPLAPVGGTGTQVMPPSPEPAPTAPPPVAPPGEIPCPQCGAQLLAGSAFCDNCGASLSAPLPPPIVAAPASPPGPSVAPTYPPPPARLVVGSSNVTLPFPQGQAEIVVGRKDPVSSHFPEIDLTDHGGDEGGVSRKHARFIFQNGQWYLEDLDSVNGSWANPRSTRQKLQRGQPAPLNNGDEIRFGRVVLTFYT